MEFTKSCFCFSIFQLLILRVVSQDRLLVDVESDIPEDGTWNVDCDNGYADLFTDFDCGPDGGGTIFIPPNELNGEKGFWTSCVFYGCKLKYRVQPGDSLFKARVYQSNIETEVSFDGISWDYIPGVGWTEFEEILGVDGKNEVSLRFSHFSPDMFNLLDKIVINGDFDPPTTTTTTTTEETTTESSSSTEVTSEATTETTESSGSTESTTEFPTETTESSTSETTTEDGVSSSTESTTTSDDDSSSTTDLDTTPVATTEDEWDSSSTVSDDPIGSSSESSTTDGTEQTSSTEVPTTLSTDNPSTETDSTTSSEIPSLPTSESTSDTTETGTTSSVTPPPSPCTDPPCITSSMPPSTTKKPTNSSGFVNGLWGKLLFSAIGVFLFSLLFVCCLRFVCIRGGVLRRSQRKEDDLQDIISQGGSSNANISGKVSPNINGSGSTEGELYLYMNRYPYLLNPSVQKADQVPDKIQISSLPSPPPPPSTTSLSSTNTLWSPRAIYRESTPYMAFNEENSGKIIKTQPSSSGHVMNDNYPETTTDAYAYVETANAKPNLLRKKASPVIPQQPYYPETQNHNRSKTGLL